MGSGQLALAWKPVPPLYGSGVDEPDRIMSSGAMNVESGTLMCVSSVSRVTAGGAGVDERVRAGELPRRRGGRIGGVWVVVLR